MARMKPPVFMDMKCSRSPSPSHSMRTLTFLWLIFLTLSLLGSVSANHPVKRTNHPKRPLTKCVICDSLVDGNCSSDSPILSNFTKDCLDYQTWCYKSQGKINTFDERGERVVKEKVDRGCAKPYFKQTCVHITQHDQTDFKVCFCDAGMCNQNLKVENQTGIMEQGAVTNLSHGRNRGWEWSWLISLSLLFVRGWSGNDGV